MTLNVLVTSFEPWIGREVNSSIWAGNGAEAQASQLGCKVTHLVLPVTYAAVDGLVDYLDEHQPDVILSFGEGSPRQREFYIEITGHNLMMSVADARGAKPTSAIYTAQDGNNTFQGIGNILCREGNKAMDQIEEIVDGAGFPTIINHFPSAYLCNRVNYHATAWARKMTDLLKDSERVAPVSLFVHTPVPNAKRIPEFTPEFFVEAGGCFADALIEYRTNEHEAFLRGTYYPSLEQAK